LVEVVYSKEYADSLGGLAALAKVDSDTTNVVLVPGTGAKASLVEGTDLTPSKQPGVTSFIYFHLNLPSTTTPPTAATSTVTAAPPAGGRGGGAGGGGLPVTGSSTAIVGGIGAALLVGGAAVFLLTRRRRARFTA